MGLYIGGSFRRGVVNSAYDFNPFQVTNKVASAIFIIPFNMKSGFALGNRTIHEKRDCACMAVHRNPHPVPIENLLPVPVGQAGVLADGGRNDFIKICAIVPVCRKNIGNTGEKPCLLRWVPHTPPRSGYLQGPPLFHSPWISPPFMRCPAPPGGFYSHRSRYPRKPHKYELSY